MMTLREQKIGEYGKVGSETLHEIVTPDKGRVLVSVDD